MAQGDFPNGNAPLADGNQDAADLGPQYVVSVMLRQGNAQMNLVNVHIPRNITVVELELVVMLVQYNLMNLMQNPLTSGPRDNPLRDLLSEDPDHWSVDLNSAGDSFGLSFYPVYNTVPREAERPPPVTEDQPSAASISPAESDSGSSSEVHSRRLSNSQVGTKRSRTTTNESLAETRESLKRKRKTNDSFENTEPKRRRSAQLSDSDSASFDDEQPGPSWRNSGETWPPSKQSSGTQSDVRQGVKRKASSHSSDRDEPKKRRADLDSASGSTSSMFSPPALQEASADDEQENSREAMESDDQRRERGGKRTRKTDRKRKSPDQDSD